MNKKQFLTMSLQHDLMICYLSVIHNMPNTIILLNQKNYSDVINRARFKPICHPLSDLTKPITHNGKTFVPMEKIELSQLDPDIVTGWIKAELLIFKNSLKLIEWHFDIAGLIEKGEAIDVNTLEINPYK